MKITKTQLRQIIKEEILREAARSYTLDYRDKGGESGLLDIYADSDEEALQKASERVKRMKGNFFISRLTSPDGEIVAS